MSRGIILQPLSHVDGSNGNTLVAGTLTVLNGATIKNGLTVKDGADIHDGLTVHGGSVLNGNVTVNYGNLAVNGQFWTGTNAYITSTENLVINPTGTLYLGGDQY